MLIIDKSFSDFNSLSDRWGVIWFSDFEKEPQNIYKIFDSLAKKASAGDDIFDWAAALSRNILYQKAEGYFEAKPGLFGFAIDLKAVINALGTKAI